jgi:hypothetical protein
MNHTRMTTEDPGIGMTVNISAWRKVVEQGVGGIADEREQRRAWFGIGPEESSPEETINQFFGDAAIREFLERKDSGLTDVQISAGWNLVSLMETLLKDLPKRGKFIDPSKLIDDPRWISIREVAAQFFAMLSK